MYRLIIQDASKKGLKTLVAPDLNKLFIMGKTWSEDEPDPGLLFFQMEYFDTDALLEAFSYEQRHTLACMRHVDTHADFAEFRASLGQDWATFLNRYTQLLPEGKVADKEEKILLAHFHDLAIREAFSRGLILQKHIAQLYGYPPSKPKVPHVESLMVAVNS